MSARILSMVSATLRFSWSDHETACRRFPADVMYIGSWTRRFRQIDDTPSTARCAVGHGGSWWVGTRCCRTVENRHFRNRRESKVGAEFLAERYSAWRTSDDPENRRGRERFAHGPTAA